MTKTVKKLDNNVVKALTVACEEAKYEVSGFQWLTHHADYANFPASLLITCVFDQDVSLGVMLHKQQDEGLRKNIHRHLLKVGILLKNVKHHVCFDTEEACLREHDGDWAKRLNQR